MNYGDFLTSINTYRDNKNIPIIHPEKKEEEYKYEKIIDFISKYYLIILIPIIVGCSALIVYLDKKDGF